MPGVVGHGAEIGIVGRHDELDLVTGGQHLADLAPGLAGQGGHRQDECDTRPPRLTSRSARTVNDEAWPAIWFAGSSF